jgi:hypothetical protein
MVISQRNKNFKSIKDFKEGIKGYKARKYNYSKHYD